MIKLSGVLHSRDQRKGKCLNLDPKSVQGSRRGTALSSSCSSSRLKPPPKPRLGFIWAQGWSSCCQTQDGLDPFPEQFPPCPPASAAAILTERPWTSFLTNHLSLSPKICLLLPLANARALPIAHREFYCPFFFSCQEKKKKTKNKAVYQRAANTQCSKKC